MKINLMRVLGVAAATGAETALSQERLRSTKQIDEKTNNNLEVVVDRRSFSSVRRPLPVQEKSVMNRITSAPLSTVAVTTTVVPNLHKNKSIVSDTKKTSTKIKKSSEEKQQHQTKRQNQNIAIPVETMVPNQEDFEAANELIQFGLASSTPSNFTSSKIVSTLASLPPQKDPSTQLPRAITDDNPATLHEHVTYAAGNTRNGHPNQVVSVSVPTVQKCAPVTNVSTSVTVAVEAEAVDFSSSKDRRYVYLVGKPFDSTTPAIASIVHTPSPFNIVTAAAAATPPIAQAENGRHVQIIDPRTSDILCGQDKTFSKHHGNQLLRMKIIETVPKYQDILKIPSVIGKKKKATEMYKDIVTEMKGSGSRFLRLIQSPLPVNPPAPGSSVNSGCVVRYWQEINDKLARDKVSHALRTYMKKYVTGNSSLHGGACADGSSYRNFNFVNDKKNNTEQPIDVDIDDYDDDLDKQICDINKRYNQDILRQHPMAMDGSSRVKKSNDNREVAVVSPSQQLPLVAALSDRKTKVVMSDKTSLPVISTVYVDGIMSNDEDMDAQDDDESFSCFVDDNIEELEELFQEQQELLRDMVRQASLPPPMVMVSNK
jgi:hypothetical protein